MNYREQSLRFACAGESLQGIATLPDSAQAIGVVIVVGGPQYRIGAHRQFVLLARRLATAGYPCLRFDMRGMGDSTGTAPGFEHCGADIAAACAALQSVAPVQKIVLWGLCDAAAAALLYAQASHDPRLAGLCLLNPWVRSTETLAKTHLRHYYSARLAQTAFWKKLLRGQVGWQAICDLWRNFRQARQANPAPPPMSFIERMAMAWRSFPGSVRVIIGGSDLTGQEFCAVQSQAAWQTQPPLPREMLTIAGADHTFSSRVWRNAVESATLEWLASLR